MKKNASIDKLPLTVEMSGKEFWGRVTIQDNLIIDTAASLDSLKGKMKAAVLNIAAIRVNDFDISFDLSSFAENYPLVNISDLARRTGISPLLMRQYTSGRKYPSAERVKQIESSIRAIGKELSKVKLLKKKNQYA